MEHKAKIFARWVLAIHVLLLLFGVMIDRRAYTVFGGLGVTDIHLGFTLGRSYG